MTESEITLWTIALGEARGHDFDYRSLKFLEPEPPKSDTDRTNATLRRG